MIKQFNKLTQWIEKKKKGLADLADKAREALDQLTAAGDPQPIPIRIDEPRRRPR